MMAARRYAKSNTATRPTMIFSIASPSHLLAEPDVETTGDEEQHNQPDIDKVCHMPVTAFNMSMR